MSLYTAAVSPKSGTLGIFTLGQSLFEITTRIKAEPKVFGKQNHFFDPDSPSTKPITITLPALGLRLRFDGPEQRLRLIEIFDFTKNVLSYKDIEIFSKSSSTSTPLSPYRNDAPAGPAFKHIYKLFGPTFSGVYSPTSELEGYGTYTLSYPGIAFNFPVQASTYNPSKDLQAILASPTTLPSSSLAIFSGANWPDARKTLYTAQLEDTKANSPNNKEKLAYPGEISRVHILGAGTLRLDRAYSQNQSHFWIQLGQTTPQELVAELGPPDAIYRKPDQHLSIHKARANSGNSESTTQSRQSRHSEDRAYGSHDDSSSQTGTGSATPGESADDSSQEGEDDSESGDEEAREAEELYWNYFHHGFDFVISRRMAPSQAPPSSDVTPDSSPETAGGSSIGAAGPERGITSTSAPLVATKMVLHGNIPGTYAFGRQRRVRWRISYLNQDDTGIAPAIGSETSYRSIAQALSEEWEHVECSSEEENQRMKGMPVNREWGDSVGSSMEVLGTWEDGNQSRMEATLKPGGKGKSGGVVAGKNAMGTSMLYGWPGLGFETGRGGVVIALTVF